MKEEIFVLILELMGVVSYAISGALVGIRKKMDAFGVVILGLTTAVGGGLIRDIVIGLTPPIMFQKPVYALTAIVVSIIVFIPAISKKIDENNWIIIIADSVGLGVFVSVGVKAGMPYNNIYMCIFLGTITGVGGGILRDVMAGEIPFIFVRHFYACACIIGAAACALMWPLGEEIAMISGAIVVIVLRLLAAKFKWHLPKAK